MRILIAVLDDLFSFARTALFGVFFESTEHEGYAKEPQSDYSPQLSLLPSHTNTSSSYIAQTQMPMLLQGAQYFIGIPQTQLYVDPVISFDMASYELPYGELVHVVKYGGRWAFITVGGRQGWILKDTLREQMSDVFPNFVEDIVYDADSTQTQKLRLCINDMFKGGDAGVLLTDAEYVSYKLGKKDKYIVWPEERPRIAGTWQKKLRGLKGIHMGINAKTDSVMEYVQDDMGHVCYVDAVFPDDSIQISSIGIYTEGVFAQMMLRKEEWIELRPIFIEIL